jgi:glycerol-3-phosphate dehydrogenase subunit C
MAFDLRDPSFFDEGALDRELTRIYDICHGCRMCFNYACRLGAVDAIDEHEAVRRDRRPHARREMTVVDSATSALLRECP